MNNTSTIIIWHQPSTPPIPRIEISNLCSEFGPISKSTTHCNQSTIKFLNPEDATKAALALKSHTLILNAIQYTLKASLAHLEQKKKRNRIILRNLSFYATEKDVRRVMVLYGEVAEISLPALPTGKRGHRGFAFVTFENSAPAGKAVAAGTVEIKGRECAMDWSMSKWEYGKEQAKVRKREREEEKGEGKGDDDDSDNDSDEEDDDDSDSDNEDDEEEDDDSDDNKEDGDDTKAKSKEGTSATHSKNVAASIFVRNLPFDATRYDLFNLFKQFGKIESIYVVKDRETKQSKGTAFLYFFNESSALEAMKAGANVPTDGETTTTSVPGLFLNSRQIFTSPPLNKSTMSNFSKEQKVPKDRRHLYLKDANHLKSDEGVPQIDLDKRHTSNRERIQKLRSPMFFINDCRLVLRNLSKSIDKDNLKALVIDAVQKGTKKNLVPMEDVRLNRRTNGVDWRDLEMEIQQFDAARVSEFIPAAHINTDPEANHTSRGFGFVEFKFHHHALACLRELDNNVSYSKDYVAGGRNVKKGDLVPRLIVEFVVENKAKAKEQEENRAKQQLNLEKNIKKDPNKVHKSRGKIQREKRRLKKIKATEEGKEEPKNPTPAKIVTPPKTKEERYKEKQQQKRDRKRGKPPKKMAKTDEFEDMVRNYKQAFATPEDQKEDKVNERAKIVEQRWFD